MKSFHEVDHLLSIIIPTYNRLPQLRKTLSLLAPQITSAISIVILDNASTQPVTKEALDISESLAKRVKIHRHKCNIGGNANLVRSLEVCETSYVWVLGDDDIPAPGSIDFIFRAIRKSPGAVAYSFAYTSKRQSFSSCLGVSGLSHASIDWSELVFISNNVYNHQILGQYIEFGYEYAYSWAPLVAILLKALQTSECCLLLSPDQLIVGNQPNQETISWSPVEFQIRKYEILNIKLNPHDRRALGQMISRSNNSINSAFINHVYNKSARGDNLLMDRLLFVHFQYATAVDRVKVILMAILIRFPRMTLLIFNILFGSKRLRSIAEWHSSKLTNS
jgi:glycosyltransferase involved in cell wall biosynthesis